MWNSFPVDLVDTDFLFFSIFSKLSHTVLVLIFNVARGAFYANPQKFLKIDGKKILMMMYTLSTGSMREAPGHVPLSPKF